MMYRKARVHLMGEALVEAQDAEIKWLRGEVAKLRKENHKHHMAVAREWVWSNAIAGAVGFLAGMCFIVCLCTMLIR